MASEAQISSCRRNLFAFTALFILVLSVYSNSFDCAWQFDDLGAIKDNVPIHLKTLDWENIKQTFFASPSRPGKLYRPVACLTIALNYYFGQTNVIGYHLVNTLIHILSAIFLFLFIYYTLNLPLLRPKYGANAYFIAFFSAAFWAINPVQIESVTYIVQRMTSLAGMFYIMAMYFYLKARIAVSKLLSMSHFAAFGICTLLAFGTKENTAMLPFSILLFDLFLIQGLKKENLKKNAYIFLVLIIVPIALALILRGPSVFSPKDILTVYETKRPFGLVEHLLTEPRVILLYVSLLFYPMQQRLSIVHDLTASQGLINPPTTLISILVMLVIFGICIFNSRKWPLICYCIFFFFMNHVIEASFFGLELVFEHRNYIPSMLLFVPLAIGFVKAMDHYSSKRTMQWILSVFIILVMVGFGNSTFLRNFDWKTEGTFWADAAKKAPDFVRPHLNLGVFYYDQKNYEKALSEFALAESSRKSINITDRPTTQYNIGLVHHGMKNWDKALEYYQKSMAVYPSNADIHNNLGLIYRKMDQMEKAEHEFREALRWGKDSIQPHKNISLLLLKQGRVKEALGYLDPAVRQWPDDAGVLGATGYAYRLMGSYGKAFLLIDRVVKCRTYDPKMHLYLSEIYFRQQKEKEAKTEIQRFIQKEKAGDLKGYVFGTVDEQDITVIQPYKNAVMQGLAQAYRSQAGYIQEKAQYLNAELLTE